MADPTQVLTKLDAVNLMLSSIGQTPVNTLDVQGIRDVAIAELTLDNVTREVLNRGWSFNTDNEWELAFTQDGEILVPAGVLWLDPVYHYQDFVVRDDNGTLKLWDRENHTFDIQANHQGPIKVNIIWAYDFEEIPNAARNYIAIRAARKFQANVIASDILYRFTAQDEADALTDLQRLENRTKDRNWFRSGADANLIATRIRNPRRWR